MPKTPCLEPGCPSFAAYRGRCYLHSKERDASIDRAGRATYNTARWRYARRAKIMQETWCERCKDSLATEVHHRVSIADGGAEYEMSNLEALCKPCHSRETRQAQIRTG